MRNIVFALLLVTFISADAAEFCVQTWSELYSAVTTASGNEQDDLIKVARGIYELDTNLEYETEEGFDLVIEGGYVFRHGDPCGSRPNKGSEHTILDGKQEVPILRLMLGNQGGNVSIRGLSFVGGFGWTEDYVGGAIRVDGADHESEILIENCRFMGNIAQYGSAIYINDAKIIRLKNNQFLYNNSTEIGTVFFGATLSSEEIGVYVTNNSFMYNTTSGNVDEGDHGGLRVALPSENQAVIANNLFWDNEGWDLYVISNYLYLWNNAFQNYFGPTPKESSGNTQQIPTFSDGLAGWQTYPAYDSPTVDAGYIPPEIVPLPVPFEDAWWVGEYDFIGDNRIQLETVDIGAVELPPELPIFEHGFE